MVDRHVVTKQRSPSIKSIIQKIEDALKTEVDPKGKEQLEKYLEYWERRKEESRAKRKVQTWGI